MEAKSVRKTNKHADLLNGSLSANIFLFAIPVMLSGILQLLFNAADIIVVGRYAGSNALAAVGSNGALINLIVNLLIGLSVGSAVTVGFYYGAAELDQVRETIHTSVAISIIGGLICAVVGYVISPYLLELMGTPENILDQAALYLKIYFVGVPAMSIYNFGSAMLRSLGDTKRPLYYLIAGGIANVMLNLVLVAGFHLDVEGVAIATVVSQVISAVLTLRCMMRMDEEIRLRWKEVRVSKTKLIRIVRIGVPAGIQSTVFSISNVLVQSSVNSFGEIVVAGNSAASNIEGFIYTAMNAFYHAAQTFMSQSLGARRYDLINKVLFRCQAMVAVIGFVAGQVVYVFAHQLLSIYLPGNEEAISVGIIRLTYILLPYFLCGMMDVMSGALRGMGESFLPMVVSLVGSCLLRVIWIYTVFAACHELPVLYLSYPISWTLTGIVHFICFLKVKKHVIRKYAG